MPGSANVKAHMSSWLLLSAALAFAWLTYDAWRVATPVKDVPYAITAKELGHDVSEVLLQEQNVRKAWNTRYGMGDLSQTVWLWGILILTCAIGAVAGFLA
jgi:hypothetical protein